MHVATDRAGRAGEGELDKAREVQNQLISVTPQVLVMAEAPTRPRDAYLLNRGLYSERGEQVTPHGIERIFPWNEELPKNRIGLAKWLFDPEASR